MSQGELLLYGVLPTRRSGRFRGRALLALPARPVRLGSPLEPDAGEPVLKYASTIFHFGVLAAIGGHVLDFLIPRSWTAAVGINDDAYHVIAVVVGGIAAGGAVCVGFALLVYRARAVPRSG